MSDTIKRTLGACYVLAEFEANDLDPEIVRRDLLENGVEKGTACKIVTILKALGNGIITPEQVTSVNRAYELARHGDQLAELQEALRRVRKAAEGDSNDEEIQALQEALSLALGMLGVME
jgi:hypothetical protein